MHVGEFYNQQYSVIGLTQHGEHDDLDLLDPQLPGEHLDAQTEVDTKKADNDTMDEDR